MTRPRSGWPSPVNADPARGGWPAALMPGRKQGWPRGVNTSADPAENLLSQAVGWWDAAYYTPGDRFLRNRGVAGELLDMRLGSSLAANSNDPLWLAPEAVGYCYFTSSLSNFLSAPSTDVTGDLDVSIRFTPDAVTPLQIIGGVVKSDATVNAWFLGVASATSLRFTWYETGGTQRNAILSGATVVPGQTYWIRATLQVNNGAGGSVASIYLNSDTGNTPPTSWTLYASQTNAFTTSVQAMTTPVAELGRAGSLGAMSGKGYRSVIKNGIDGTVVTDINCDVVTSGAATSFTEQSSNAATVTINRATSGRKTVAMPARGRGGRACFLLGTDDYLEVQDNWQHQLLNFGQGDSFTIQWVGRQWTSFATTQRLLGKINTGTSDPAWGLRSTSANNRSMVLSDGTAQFVTGPTLTSGAFTVVTTPVTTSAAVYEGTTPGNTVTRTAKGIVNRFATRIGAAVDGGYADMEFTAAAVLRRALTAAEITLLTNYYTNRGY